MGRKPNPAPGFLQAVQEQYKLALQNGQKGLNEFYTTVLPAMQVLWGGAKEGTANAANTAKQAVKNAASKLPKTSTPIVGTRPEFLVGVGDTLLDAGSTGRLPISKGLASAGLLTAILAGGMELADENDPLGRNIVEGLGVTGGQVGGGVLGGMAAGALAGGATGAFAPVAIPAGMIIGGLAGGDVLKNLGGGLYDAATGINSQDRAMARQKEDLERRQELALYEMQLAMENQRAMDQFNADQFENQLLMRDKLDDRSRVQQLYDNSMANDQALITSILASL
jgi:hypothetical protein